MPKAERMKAVTLINEAHEAGARKKHACELLEISLRTLQRWENPEGECDKRQTVERQAPKNKLTQEERERVLATANSEKYRDLSPSKIVPLLADEGNYLASESTFYRILREEKQQAHRQRSKPAAHHKPNEYSATSSNQVWSWDISYLPTAVLGTFFYLYLILDIYSRKIVGWSIHENESSELSSGLIKQACLDEGVDRDQLVLHSDNGKPMKGASMLSMLEVLGIIPSFNRPSVSDDNPYSESLFRTIKYHPTFPILTRFTSIEDARVWMEKFVTWYNTEHLHSGLKFVTPHQRHTGEDKMILQNRHQVYTNAKRQNPERWTGDTRNWTLPNVVTLNPDRKGGIKFYDSQDVNMLAA